MLYILGGLSLLELLLWTPGVWPVRKPLAVFLCAGLALVSGGLFSAHIAVWSGLVALLGLYRIVNLLRIIEARLQADYLLTSWRRAYGWLIGLQILCLGLAALNAKHGLATASWWLLIAGLQLLVAVVLVGATWRNLRATKPPLLASSYADRDLPTVTVAIPARNETAELEACLQSLTASSYPKLEIIVLDDCSPNKHTPEIIRSFAHDGVRFIGGQPPAEQWLAKNYAYAQLTDAANGELLLFCGVDTRFEPESLRAMVEIMLTKKKAMLSWLPRNSLPGATSLERILLQPNRYAWELALPRRHFNRPAVLSTCWLISRHALQAAGGFAAVSHSVSPESFFARWCLKHDDGYSFQQSNSQTAISSVKTFSEQRATAVRVRYPQLHRRLELVAALSFLEFAILVAPFLMALGSLIMANWLLSAVSGVSCLLLMALYARIVSLTYRHFLLRGLWLLPFAALYDIALLNYSLWQYEFNEVIWKGRNVCLPVMRVIPRLPNIDT